MTTSSSTISNNDKNSLQIVVSGPSLQQQKIYEDSSKDA